MNVIHPQGTPFVDHRRSQRILLSIPVQISGINKNGLAFTEQTKTEAVNSHGGRILLKERVSEGQALKMKNLITEEETQCTVAQIKDGPDEVNEVGLELAGENARFWRVSFPPRDWSPRGPEAKRFEKATVAIPVPAPAGVKKQSGSPRASVTG